MLKFLCDAIFDIFILLILFRFLLQWVQADFYNPLTQFIVKITKPLMIPMEYFLPTIKHCNFAALFLAISLEFCKIVMNFLMHGQGFPGILGTLLWAVSDLADYLVHVYFYSILLLAFVSWFKPMGGNALLEILYKVTWPLMKPFRRVIPPVAGIDLSPVPAMLALKGISIFILEPAMAFSMQMALNH
jgi:YggT family protein